MSVKIAVMVPHPPLIIPEVGKGEEKAISSTISAYQEAARQVAACHPDTLVICFRGSSGIRGAAGQDQRGV